ANRLGIDRVVLAALDVALDILRRHQQHRAPQHAQKPRPVMRGAARLDADSRRRQLGKEFLDLAAPQLPPQYRLLVLVNSMNLKDMFGRIQTNPDNRHSDGSPGCVVARSQPGTFDAVGGRPHQQSLSPVLSTSWWTASLPARGRDTGNVSPRRLSVEWSGAARSRPSGPSRDAISPSVWRSARRKTTCSVSAVVIAKAE